MDFSKFDEENPITYRFLSEIEGGELTDNSF